MINLLIHVKRLGFMHKLNPIKNFTGCEIKVKIWTVVKPRTYFSHAIKNFKPASVTQDFMFLKWHSRDCLATICQQVKTSKSFLFLEMNENYFYPRLLYDHNTFN